jgi:hypothetical protein
VHGARALRAVSAGCAWCRLDTRSLAA